MMRRVAIVLGIFAVCVPALLAEIPAEMPKEEKSGKETPPHASSVHFSLEHRESTSVGDQHGLGFKSGGFIEVIEPSPDMIVIAMTGMTAAAGSACATGDGSLQFDLVQNFTVEARPDVASVKMTLDAQLIGLLRAQRPGAGSACVGPAHISVQSGGTVLMEAGFAGRSHVNAGNVFVNDRFGPATITIEPGRYTLHQSFSLHCAHPKRCFDKNVVVAAFGPPSPRVPDWLSILDPTRELPRQRDVGFRTSLRLQGVPKKP